MFQLRKLPSIKAIRLVIGEICVMELGRVGKLSSPTSASNITKFGQHDLCTCL